MFQKKLTARLTACFAFSLAAVFFGEATHRECFAQSSSQVQLYFFTNDGCAPCLQVEPAIESLKRQGFPVSTIKLSNQPEMGSRFRVDKTPTVILVVGNKVEGRHAGLIDEGTLQRWFAVVGVTPGTVSNSGVVPVPMAPPQGGLGAYASPSGNAPGSNSTSTMHHGTRQPVNLAEQRAMGATVRLRVEDPEGTSYATGTVIHSSAHECLVLTCGHVFRDAKGAGEITAEYGLGTGPVRTGSGKLVFYDSDARDIGLVVIQTSFKIEAVPIAMVNSSIEQGRDVFSLGCDRGELPTIRHSRIKRRAKYNDAIKYDIYGRPVDGRSGGGLFTSSGELIGVCNAAAVEVDEGIYTALDTIYWQLARVNLDHLFGGQADTRIASNAPALQLGSDAWGQTPGSVRPGPGVPTSSPSNLTMGAGVMRAGPLTGRFTEVHTNPGSAPSRTHTVWNEGVRGPMGEKEVIIIVRSRIHPAQADTITISNPTPELLDYLAKSASGMSQPRQRSIAALKATRPQLAPVTAQKAPLAPFLNRLKR